MKMSGLGSDDYDASGNNKAATVSAPELLNLAHAWEDWFCPACQAGNRGDSTHCVSCGCAYNDDAEEYPEEVKAPPVARPRPFQYDWKKVWIVMALVSVVSALLMLWAFQTHGAEGDVAGMAWEQQTLVQTWTQTQIRSWKHQTTRRAEVEPRNGEGERAGMFLIPNTCQQEHYEDESYACGTTRVCTPRTRTESYACGESCSSNGNGFASCTTRYCTRSVPDGESCSDQTKYCSRPIYKDRCSYQTQVWKTTKTLVAKGIGTDTFWHNPEIQRLDRLRFQADYEIRIAYQDRGKDRDYTFKPGNTSWLGWGATPLNKQQAQKAEASYHEWRMGSAANLTINNLGGVWQVNHPEEANANH